jgi:putative GTP pyrophosphokinase
MRRSRSRRGAPSATGSDGKQDPQGQEPRAEPQGSSSPESPPLVPVRNAVQTYAAQHPDLCLATEGYVDMVTSLLDEAGINYLSVTGRTKSVASFAAKAVRQTEGRPAFTDPLTQITDQIGVRVITYLRDDVDAVADLLSDELTLLDDRDMGQETADDGRWGYASRHLLLTATPESGADAEAHLRDRRASVQVRTVLQHAWAEFEHDIRYKGTIQDEHAPDLNRRFALAAGLLELADREFSAIRDRVQATMTFRPAEPDAPAVGISSQELTTFLAARYTDAGWSRTDHYTWISGLLLELDITSVEDLDALLGSVDDDAVQELMGYQHPTGAVRRLDDALLSVFGPRYLDLDGNAHRTARLKTRLEKLWSSAPPT